MASRARTPSPYTLRAERQPLLQDLPAQSYSSSISTAEEREGSITVVSKVNGISPEDISASNRYLILAGIWIAMFLGALNTTLVATLITSISSDFNKSNQSGWLGTSYLLATCTFTPLYGRLSDVLGRRRANQTAVLFAALGTLLCGVSRNMGMLIAGRFLAGIGGGGIFTTASIVTSDLYSMRSRGLTQGISNIFNGFGMGIGGPLGGLISDRLGWRWAFLIQLPLFALAFLFTTFNLRYVLPGQGKNKWDILKRIDWGGSLTLMLTVLCFLTMLSLRYNDDQPWTNPLLILATIGTILSSLTFLLIELRLAPEPVLPPYLLRQKVPVLVGVNNFLVGICNFTVMYFLPMWFETVVVTSVAAAGAHLFPNSISMSCGSLFAGYIMHRTGRYKTLNAAFGILPFIGAVLVASMRPDSPPALQWLAVAPMGFGNIIVLQTTLIALLAHVPKDTVAVATGFGQVFRGLGQVCGVGVSSAIFQYVLNQELRARIKLPNATEIIYNIRHSARLVADLPPDLQRDARESYAIALRRLFILAACSTALAYLVRLPIPGKDLDEAEEEQRAKPTGDSSTSTPDPQSLTSTRHAASRSDSDPERGDR